MTLHELMIELTEEMTDLWHVRFDLTRKNFLNQNEWHDSMHCFDFRQEKKDVRALIFQNLDRRQNALKLFLEIRQVHVLSWSFEAFYNIINSSIYFLLALYKTLKLTILHSIDRDEASCIP